MVSNDWKAKKLFWILKELMEFTPGSKFRQA
jgi:hypothetical protein